MLELKNGPSVRQSETAVKHLCLCQGIGTDPTDPTQKLVIVTDKFHVILYDDIPQLCVGT